GERGNPARPVLRLSHEYPALSSVAGVLPRAQATDVGGLGQERRNLRGRRCRPVQARHPERRDPHVRYGALRPRDQRAGNCEADSRILGSRRPRAGAPELSVQPSRVHSRPLANGSRISHSLRWGRSLVLVGCAARGTPIAGVDQRHLSILMPGMPIAVHGDFLRIRRRCDALAAQSTKFWSARSIADSAPYRLPRTREKEPRLTRSEHATAHARLPITAFYESQ